MAIVIGDKIFSYTKIFKGSRLNVRKKAVNFVIKKLLEILK